MNGIARSFRNINRSAHADDIIVTTDGMFIVSGNVKDTVSAENKLSFGKDCTLLVFFAACVGRSIAQRVCRSAFRIDECALVALQIERRTIRRSQFHPVERNFVKFVAV